MMMRTLQRAFLRKIQGMSSREAALHTGLAFSTIARMRRGEGIAVSQRIQRAMHCYVHDEPCDELSGIDRLRMLEKRVDVLETQLHQLLSRGVSHG
jgi:hypothetical protein